MPNLNGTGPDGKGPLTGRRRGRCRDTQTIQTEKNTGQPSENNEVVHGLGRGGRPRGGGGLGNRFGQGFDKAQGRGRRRGFENK